MRICSIAFLLIFYAFHLSAQDEERSFHSWAPAPPMGWNSYDCFGAAVNESEVLANAKIMEIHLKASGWEYIVIDYCWFYPHVGALNNPPQTGDFLPRLPMDEYGRLYPASDRFPSSMGESGFKAIGDAIHAMGLKFGIHVMRGVPRQAVAEKAGIKGSTYSCDQIAVKEDTCYWLNTMYGVDMSKPGAQEYYNSLFELYASWGVDYVKVDDISTPYHGPEIEAIRKAIDHCGRPMVLSLSPGNSTPLEKAEHLKNNANLWRISGDFWDHWEALYKMFKLTHEWEGHIGRGHYPDADMIPIGMLNRRGPGDGVERRSGFTRTEQYTLMSLWAICRSPLMYGGDLQMMRPHELKLLTNREVLAVNQHSSNSRQLFRKEELVAWIAEVPGSADLCLALFNIGDQGPRKVEVNLSDLGINGDIAVRDLWEQKDLGTFRGSFGQEIEAHGSGLYRIQDR